MTKIKAQAPADGILKKGDYGDSKFYTVVCSCGNPDDEIDFEIEVDECRIHMNTWTIQKSDYWSLLVDENYQPYIRNSFLYSIDSSIRKLINGIHTRISLTYKLWTVGYLKYHQTTIMTEQQALNYAETIKTAIKDMHQFQKDQELKRKKND
jgi:hypothetical protein